MITPEVVPQLKASFSEKTIDDLILMFGHGQLNLEPGFQRRSVWTWTDRRRLIQSILSHYPLPSIFLYQRNSRGRTVYDVIDGKQRLETIFMFTRQGRFKRDAFELRVDRGEGLEWCDWRELRSDQNVRHEFQTYKIPVTEVTGDLASIIDLFVRINSTGKPLTPGEKRHARFYDSAFLKEADAVVVKFRKYLIREKVLTEGQLERMKGTELMSELLMSIHQGGIINKKTSLDRAIGNESVNGNTLSRLSRELVATVNTIKKVFPDLRTTRFHNSAEFYSLAMLMWEMRHAGFVLNDRKRNLIAQGILCDLSAGVDRLRERMKKVKGPGAGNGIYADYLLTVQGDTDSAANRNRRREILHNLLASLFTFKDGKRLFTPEQRRILWHSDQSKVCRSCKKALTWDNVTVDHVLPHSKGGPTSLPNAHLMCRTCNSRKGAR